MAAAAAVSLRRRQRTRITTMTLSLLSCLVLLSLLLPIASAQRLFFSSYTHTATNSIIEVFNPSCATAVTTEFDIRIATYSTHAAGSVWLAAIPLGGAATLLPQATRSVCRAAFAGCTTVNTGMVFSGQEAIGLFHNNVLIDIIGSITSMNGDACANCPSGRTNNAAPWLVAGVLSATFQHTLLRKPRVTEGTTDFFHPKGSSVINPSSSEWTVSAVGTNVLGTYPATRTNVCPNGAYIGLFYATCGTIGSSLPTTTSTLQVVCPVDCISRVTQHVVGTGYPRLSGSNGRYSLTTPVCLAAYHSNIVSYNGNSFPRASFTPQPTAGVIASICNYSPTSSQPLYTDASLFPSSSRPNGRPHLLVTFLPSTSQTFVGAVEQCIVSTSSTVTGGVNLQLLNTTMCDPTQCGGTAAGHCNQNTGLCLCNSPYSGSYCQNKLCVHGCYNGACDTTTGTCTCTTGFYGEQCILRTCTCNGHGTCDAHTGFCTCSPPWSGPSCTSRSCPHDCSGHGSCDWTTGTCTCDGLHVGEDCSLRSCGAYCSGFGMCDYTTGQCRCQNSTPAGSPVPAQCLFDTCPTSAATPGAICSGNGVCDFATRMCTCNKGWVGEDCAITQGLG